jgi:uncharacterized membrane protein
MRLNFREISGLVLIVLGLIIIPAAWAFSRTLTVIAFVLFGVGVALFYTERIMKREERMAKEAGSSGGYCGNPMPTDIHNYTGWRTGGRRADDNDGDVGGGGDGD